MTSIHESAPNPQFVRNPWIDLTGPWRLRYDDDNAGLESEWWNQDFSKESLEITIPFPPESELSGIGDPSFHPTVWYQRVLPQIPADADECTLIRFGAVDYEATVWINNTLVGHHVGGSSPFAIEVSTAWIRSLENPRLTLRIFDDPRDIEQPRGKQAWTEEPDGIWYKRTTGIWQPVWLEFVPATYLDYVRWVFDADNNSIGIDIELNHTPSEPLDVSLTVFSPNGDKAETVISMEERRATGRIDLTSLGDGNGLAAVLWSPESPTLLPTQITLSNGDQIDGYVGLRTVSVDRSGFRINTQPTWLRLVLSQGYFPESCYAAPSVDALRRAVELTLALGFNGARTHQKAEDPRYLYWADKLGLLIWGEIGAAYAWSDAAIGKLTNEWRELVRRDINHPSVIAWVPFNESWGIGNISASTHQQHAVRSIYALTHSLDGTRPVIGNDGWEHVSTDVFSLHDYNWQGDELRSRYSSGKNNNAIAETYSEAGKNAIAAMDRNLNDLPIMITEYGGVSFAPSDNESWYGYGKVTNNQEFEDKYRELTSALHDSDELVGICYTQLTDTEQETNGLLTEDRKPKIDLSILRSITRGDKN